MKTQLQIYEEQQRKISNLHKLFLETQAGPNPLTDAERNALADKRPQYEFMRVKP